MRIATRQRWERTLAVLSMLALEDIGMSRRDEENCDAARCALDVLGVILALPAEQYDALPEDLRRAIES